MEWLQYFWDWFWWYRKGEIKYRIWDFGEYYMAMATNGKSSVWNCYGSTPEAAKEMALYKIQRGLNREIDESNVVYRQKL